MSDLWTTLWGQFASKEETDLDKLAAIDHDLYDVRMFDRVLNLEHDIPVTINEEVSEKGEFRNAARLFDIFNSFYKAFPHVRESVENHNTGQFINNIMDSEEYQLLRSFTTLEEFGSALASFKLFEKIQENKELQKHTGFATDSEPREEVADINVGDDDNLELDSQDEMRYAIRQILQETKEDVEQTIEALRGMGVGKDTLGQMNSVDAFEKAKVLERSPSLRKIAELAGRMQIVMKKAQKEKIYRQSGTVVGVEIGAEIQRLLPAELFKFLKLRKLFYRDLLERKLQQYSVEFREDLGKGPIVICIDFSGSMSGHAIIWAKAIAIVLMRLAEMQKRVFMVIPFNDGVLDDWVYINDKGHLSLETQLEDFAKSSPIGGTDYVAPIKKAHSFIINETFLQKADLIFITDGSCEVSTNFTEWWKKERIDLGITMYSFLINMTENDTIKRLSDQVIKIDELTEKANGIETLFSL